MLFSDRWVIYTPFNNNTIRYNIDHNTFKYRLYLYRIYFNNTYTFGCVYSNNSVFRAWGPATTGCSSSKAILMGETTPGNGDKIINFGCCNNEPQFLRIVQFSQYSDTVQFSLVIKLHDWITMSVNIFTTQLLWQLCDWIKRSVYTHTKHNCVYGSYMTESIVSPYSKGSQLRIWQNCYLKHNCVYGSCMTESRG